MRRSSTSSGEMPWLSILVPKTPPSLLLDEPSTNSAIAREVANSPRLCISTP